MASAKTMVSNDLSKLCAELLARLKSRGGRPALTGATRRQKIPLRQSDWAALEVMAREIAAVSSRRITPAQIASHLLTRALSEPAGTRRS